MSSHADSYCDCKDCLHTQIDRLVAENQRLRDALRTAPPPIVATGLSGDAWDDAYEEWWNASRAAVRVKDER